MRIQAIILIISAAGLFFAGTAGVHAASPLFMVSWKSDNYVPAWFLGKIFPINKSNVTVSFELMSQSKADFGKIVDLKSSDVRWYVNDDYVTDGNGLKSFTFSYPQTGGDASVKISANYFDPDTQSSSFVNYYLTIPRSTPQIVFDSKSFDQTASPNSTLNIRAYPFFFNASDDSLQINWSVNDQQPKVDYNNPLALSVKIGNNLPSSGVKISLSLSNPVNLFENAANSLFFKLSQ